ncbi:MAG TPA: ABC transporter permease [Gaiellaceae bacterium]|jgi:peptide/nickel transport system permease protein|nr:ABC transporter permease [Gaiellaceae bacterium]
MPQREQEVVVPGGAGLSGAVAAESGPDFGSSEDVKARGYWELVWRRFRRDKIAIASGFFIIFLILVAFVGAPVAKHYVGHGPDDIFTGTAAVDSVSLLPADPWTHIDNYYTNKRDILVLGGANRLGQDEFLRLLYGARVSLEVALLSTLGVMIIGVLLGSIAGYFRGTIDTIISRITEVTMAFPLLLFIVALAATVGPQLDAITLGGIFPKGVVTLVLIFSLFSWYYPARIMRAQVLSIREKEYIEAARMIGASDARIIRSHVIPHLIAPMIVYSTLIVASFVLLEAGLSFLGLGIKAPTASWGNLLSSAPEYYTTRPLLMIWPGLAVLLTTLAFNLLGDGLRDAFDPRSSQQ